MKDSAPMKKMQPNFQKRKRKMQTLEPHVTLSVLIIIFDIEEDVELWNLSKQRITYIALLHYYMTSRVNQSKTLIKIYIFYVLGTRHHRGGHAM